MRIRSLAAAFAAGSHLLLPAAASAQQAGEADLVDRLELYGVMQTINVDILASTSATLTLETWCDRLDLAAEPKVTVRFLPGEQREASAEQRQRLQVGADEPIRYRKVQLVCGNTVLSEADNWYVPSRLTPAMNQTLETSDVPFGRVIRPLEPFRRTFAAETLWQPLPAGWETLSDAALADAAAKAPPVTYDAARPMFEHQALVLRKDGLPIAEVRETYKMALLGTKLD